MIIYFTFFSPNKQLNYDLVLKSMINSIQYKTDIAMNEVEMSRLRQIASEAKKFYTNLEQIELLKMDHVESPELNVKVNELFTAFNNLCVRIVL